MTRVVAVEFSKHCKKHRVWENPSESYVYQIRNCPDCHQQPFSEQKNSFHENVELIRKVLRLSDRKFSDEFGPFFVR